MMAIKLLALVCLAGAALAGPLQRDAGSQCSVSCPEILDEKFQFQPGKRYVYSYKGIDYVAIAGGRKEQKSEITANVQIDVLERCEMSLQIRDFNYRGEQSLSEDLEQQLAIPLRFSWVDGKIENICSNSDESQESENIKRGILSAILNTMTDLRSPSEHQEVDSLGSCQTKYTILRVDERSVIVRKEKALKSCDNRHSGLAVFPFNPYQSPESNIQNLPLFSHEKFHCEQEIENQVIKVAICKASAQIKPLSKYDSLVQFQGEVHLELQDVQRVPTSMLSNDFRQPSSEMNKKSIRYNYDQTQDVQSREREANEILAELCHKTEGLLHPSISKLYLRLIMVLKGLPADSVKNLYDSLKSRQICRSPKTLDIFLDALPMAGTEGSIKLMVELLRTKQVSGLKAKIWPASFALIPNPNAEAIAAVLPLVSGEEKSRPVLLGLSAMIYKICSNTDCDRIESVRHAASVLQQGLGSQCSSDNDEEVISILKAFGNMGYHGQAEETILSCAHSSEKPIPVRLAAIEAFRRYTKEIPSALTELYSSQSEHFEVRIAALLTAVTCEDSRVSSVIQRVLDNDQDEQVVAYTLSLVKNLQETSSPLKQSMKQSLQHIKTERTVGYWENSKNIEWSAFNVPTNLGASLESNIIHSHGSKIPRSFSSKIDIDIFGKNVNIFEFGTRVEGLEKVAKKFLGMDESSKQKRSWFTLTSRSNEEEDTPEISFYARTFGTEYFDMTLSDFTSIGNMMRFADIVNKLSQGEKKVDFAHSFLFLNTKVIIPSVTGRSYAFGMTGSATVGLSANGKFDVINLMSTPRNCDIRGRIQPSANVEITTTLGIHSEKSRPDIKIVTSFHSEADVGTKLRVKDSHMAEAKLDFPAEKVQLLKISTELFEVDANDNETPIIEEMQTKIDHCILTLGKPLGLQLCTKFETPRPFICKNFPYARGLGNFELAIRKTDSSMRGYIATLEIPKHLSDHMTYRLAMDTPGSSVNRKFQAILDLRRLPSGESEFKLDAQSPFKDFTTSGSYIWRPDLVQGALTVIVDKSHRYSTKAVVEISRSSSEISLKPTLQWTLPSSDPVSVSGSIVYSNRRKQHLMVDLRSTKPGERPYVFTGNMMKDGTFGLSRRDQWKMSADLVAKTPFLTTKVHSTADKQSGQTQSVASSFSVDYETQRSRKQSIKFSSKLQQSSSKVSTSVQFEATQCPQYNWLLSWDMQGNPKDAMKNEIRLGYGRNPERSFFQIYETHQLKVQNALSEGKVSVKAPQLSIDSELKVSVGTSMQETGTFHIESDLRYKEQRHVKALIQLKQLSKSPVKMSVKAQLEYPGRKLMYKDEIEEISTNIYEGHSILQWQSNQQASLQYKYKKLSDDSTFHHEIESTFKAPFMRSQIENQVSVKASKENMEIRAELQGGRQASYKLDAHLRKRGQSRISISAPVVEGSIEVSNEPEKKSGLVNVELKTRNPQRLVASAALNLGSQKRLQTEVSWNADANPSEKMLFKADIEADVQRSQKSYRAHSQIQVFDHIKVDASCSCEKGNQISLQSKIDVSGRKFESFSIETHNEVNRESIRSTINYKKGRSEKAVLQLNGKYAKQSRGCEIQGTISMKSPDHSFEDKELFIHHSFDRSHSSSSLQCTVRLENAPGKKYESTVEYSSEAKLSRKLRLAVETPYRRFAKQEISFSQRMEQSKQTVNAAVQCYGKEIALTSVLAKTNQGRSISCSLKTPFDAVKHISVFAALENQQSQKQVESHLELNGQKRFEYSASYVSGYGSHKIQSSAKLFLKSEFAMNLNAEKDKNSLSHEFFVTKDSSRIMSYRISHRVSGDEFTCQIEAESSRDKLIEVKLTKEVKGSVKYTFKSNKPFTPISVILQSKKSDENSRNIMISACRESSDRLCYAIKGYYKREGSGERYSKQRKMTLDVEKVTGRGSAEPLYSIHYLLSQQDRSIKSKFFVEMKEKKYGYELTMKQRSSEDKPCELDISFTMPSRTFQCSLSAIHNAQHSAYEFTAIPSTSSPNHKVVLELKRNWDSHNKELSGEFKLRHPALERPISAKLRVSKGHARLLEAGKLELDYSKNPEDRLILELSSQSPRSQSEMKGFQCRLYTQGKEMDLVLKASMHQTSHKDSYIYEWSWQSHQGKKSGKLNVELSDKRSGRPQTVQVEITCPHYHYTVVGNTEWVSSSWPVKAELKFSSNSRVIGEVSYDHSDSCTEVEIRSSAPVFKNRVCMNKSEQRKFTLLSVECICQENKCFDMSIDLDPSQSHVANVGIKWHKEQFQQLLERAKNLKPVSNHFSYKEIKQEITRKVEMLCSPLKKQVLEPIYSHMMEEARQICNEQLQEMKQITEYVKSLSQRLPEFPSQEKIRQQFERLFQWLRDDALKYLEKHAPAWLYDEVKSILQIVEKYFNEYCKRGTLCYKVKQTYQRRGMKHVQQLLMAEFQERIEKLQREKDQRMNTVKYWVTGSWGRITEWFKAWTKDIMSLIPSWKNFDIVRKWLENAEKTKEYLEKKGKEYFDELMKYINDMMDHARKNENFKVFSALVEDAKFEIVKLYQQIDVKQILEPLLQKYPINWFHEKVNVSDFDIQSGNVQVQVHHPFDQSKMQLLKNVLVMIKNKCQSYQM